ncbi:MAG: indole-3-glycerol phosphate synthase TrpC [Alphaproteobacteria bacterium]|nr:indole-3-glycerol phosphate synthase TrpC [Alphaproteobacteria bacterium]
MNDVLARICAEKRAEIAAAKRAHPSAELAHAARRLAPPRGFAKALAAAVAAGRYGLIAEIKMASPSGGMIRPDFDPAALARAYERGGAACLSVLTDEPNFKGRPEHLVLARAAVRLPVLRKDFMLDPYQVSEARALGADCILIILAAVSDAEAAALERAARELGMDVLAEVHDTAELYRALRLKTRLIGINNRNLKTLKTDLATTEKLAALVPRDRIVVSESGISQPADLARLARAGAKCFLIGESLLRQPDVEQAARALLAPAEARA